MCWGVVKRLSFSWGGVGGLTHKRISDFCRGVSDPELLTPLLALPVLS